MSSAASGETFNQNRAELALKNKLAFTNSLSLEMAAKNVKLRFERARDACLSDAKYKCVLINATLNMDNNYSYRHSGRLEVRLPHEEVKDFEDALLLPLPNENKDELQIQNHAITAEDLSKPIADVDMRLKELTAYRDRLLALSKRTDAKVEDMIKVEEQLATTQTQVEQITAQQKNLNERITTEVLNVNFNTAEATVNNAGKIEKVWREAGTTLSRNTADALRVAIASIPWLPVILIGAFILRFVVRLVRAKKAS